VLMIAAQYSDKVILNKILEKNPDKAIRDKYSNKTAAQLAVETGEPDGLLNP
jgi:hypothetical protein